MGLRDARRRVPPVPPAVPLLAPGRVAPSLDDAQGRSQPRGAVGDRPPARAPEPPTARARRGLLAGRREE